ncbi:hypothetical protein CLV51_10813 [Chitinophaga niastensis]|uniref:Uncharacterized protein n=1 Tax=Chitinophaga niastensis TaxID=536980 RepID=A0A2P8HAT0_CHINA|nr:hypothetical protein CLV51_10813 [Chitinophaga niastensis]
MLGVECLILIPFVVNFKLLNPPAKWIFYYIISSIIFAAGSWLLSELFGNNMWFFSVMYFVQFVILSVFYWLTIKNEIVRTLIKIMPFIILLIFLLDFFKLEGIKAFNSISGGIRNIVIMVYAIIFFLQLLKDKDLIEKAIYIDSLPVFWYNAGIFIFFCTSLLFNISYNIIQESGISNMGMTLTILVINYIVGIISMILFYIGLSKTKKLRYANS